VVLGIIHTHLKNVKGKRILKLKFLKMLEEPKVEWEFPQGWSGVIQTQKPYTGEVQNDIFWISKMFFCVLVWQLYFMFLGRGEGYWHKKTIYCYRMCTRWFVKQMWGLGVLVMDISWN